MAVRPQSSCGNVLRHDVARLGDVRGLVRDLGSPLLLHQAGPARAVARVRGMGAHHACGHRARADCVAPRLAAEGIRTQDGSHGLRGRGAGRAVLADSNGRAMDELVARRHPDRDGAVERRPHCTAVRCQGAPRRVAHRGACDRFLRRHCDRRPRYRARADAVGRRRVHHDLGRGLRDRSADRRAIPVGCRRARGRGREPGCRIGPAVAVCCDDRAGSRSFGAVALCSCSAGDRVHRDRAVPVLLSDQCRRRRASFSRRVHQPGRRCGHRRAGAERAVRCRDGCGDGDDPVRLVAGDGEGPLKP